jgi:hypothetical protein
MAKAEKKKPDVENKNPVGVFVPVGEVLARKGVEDGKIEIVKLGSKIVEVKSRDGETVKSKRKVETVEVVEVIPENQFKEKYKQQS